MFEGCVGLFLVLKSAGKKDKTLNSRITRGSTRIKLVPYESYDFCDSPRTKLASNNPFLIPLKNYFENGLVRLICGGLKVPSFSKITMMTGIIIASE